MNAEDQAANAARSHRIEPLTRLATGGMADIWLAREIGAAGLERFVVVKRLLPHLAREPEIVDMFVSEARFVARLVHPNVVQIHDLAEDDDGYYLVMEYVEGCSVRELMVAAHRAGKRLSPDVGICIVEQACRGAHAAHELKDPSGNPLGLVHRDISPHNLMIGATGDVKLLDFGIAKATEAGGTHTGSLKGKCSYMSPEQCRAFRLDRRSDVFSLGIVLWELLCGKRLFQRDAEYASMEAIVTGDYQLPSEVVPELPAALDQVIENALATKVEARYQTADELRRALIDAADRSGIRPSRDALAASLTDLLGKRLDQRERALRRAATSASDPSGLRDVLVPSDSSLQPSGSGLSHKTGSDDVVTVVQRKSARPGPKSDTATGSDAVTLLDQPKVDGEPGDLSPDIPPSPRVPNIPIPEQEDEAPPGLVPRAPDPILPPDDLPPAPKRRVAIVVAVLAAVLIGVVTLLSVSRDKTLSGPPLRFVVAPTVEPEVIEKELAPFNTWLGEQLDRPVELVIASSYEHAAELLTSGRADIGLFPPLLFTRTKAEHSDLQPLALRLYDGARASDGYLLVRADEPINEANDLRGRTICFVDKSSTTGFLLPRIWLRDKKIDPDVDIKTRLSGDHLAALRDLSEGACDAAAVYSGAYLSAQEQGIRVGTMRVLTITGRVPQDVIAAGPSVKPADAERVKKSLIDFQPQRDIGAPRVGAVLGISGFARFDPEEFAKIRQAAEQEGIIPATGK